MSYTPFNDLEKIGGVAVVTASPGLLAVAGTLTHNTTVSSTGNFGVLSAVASNLMPVYTEGKQVLLSTDLSGNLRVNVSSVSGTFTQASAGPTAAAPPAQADYIGINVSGTLRGVTGISVGSVYAPTIAIVDGSGNQITTFGGGTQYATGTVVATPTGTAALGWDSANVRVLSTDVSGQLKVLVQNSVSVTGTFWQATQPVSLTSTAITGTVAVTESGLWNVNQAIGVAGFGKVTDGTNTAVVKAASVAALATDPALVVTTNGSTTAGTPVNTAVTSTSSAVLAANTARREVMITNTDVVAIYIAFGQTPTATAYHVVLRPCTVVHDGSGGTFVSDIFKGAINAIAASTTGHISVVELT